MEATNAQFQTMAEVNEYLSHNTISCLVCGKDFQRLNHHLQVAHCMTPDEYRLRFGIPQQRSLASVPSRAKSAAAMNRPERMAQFAAARQIPHTMERGKWKRGRVPAVADQWRKSAESGRYFSRKLVIVKCDKCGCDVATTALGATQSKRCMTCTTRGARNARRSYWKRKWAA